MLFLPLSLCILFQELQADFEGRNPEDCDFHGIKQLLRQLFLKSNVDLGALSQIIICKLRFTYFFLFINDYT